MFLRVRSSILSTRHACVLAGGAICAWASRPAAPQERAALVSPAPGAHGGDTAALRRGALPGPYPAEIIRVLDGDTFEARVRVWFGQEVTTLVRIRGIDAPELKGRCGDELRGAQSSREALSRMLAGGAMLRDIALDKYAGRILAAVIVPGLSNSGDVAAEMIAAGWARPYGGGKRGAWCPLAPVGRG